MMHQDDPEWERRREMLRALTEAYPGPIACAAAVPPGTTVSWGNQHENDLPYSAQARYRDAERGTWLQVRTVRPPADPPPVILTVESTMVTLLNFRTTRENERDRGGPRRPTPSRDESRTRTFAAREEDERTPERASEVIVDGMPIPARRKDFPDCAVLHFDWTDGTHVWCAGAAEAIDALALRSEDRMPHHGPDRRPPQST
ncbi:hypothetical protein [Actinospica robiniae]|uniref:hypothetical protein n=1 Tax=Actinospica robiniae TaxID=304901 RepID=UPI0012FA0C92|nr:hypothetical protein [Actinospica robiniae]